MVTCCVYSCSERHEKGKNISFYKFPRDSLMRKKWLRALRRPILKPTIRVCSRHFKEDDYVLNKRTNKMQLSKNAVPSVFDFTKEYLSKYKDIKRKTKGLNHNTNTTPLEGPDDLNRIISIMSYPESLVNKAKNFNIKKNIPFYSDYCEEDLKDTEKANEIWKLTKKVIEKQHKSITRLHNCCTKAKMRKKMLENLISHVRKTYSLSLQGE